MRGVNLGGWLVLEKWMTPSLFSGLKAVDETTFCMELGDRLPAVLEKHWETFITEDDFRWLAERGINAVRIPIGHWIFGDYLPIPILLKDRQPQKDPNYRSGIHILDFAMETAQKHGLDVLIDLHAAPGCQNGFDNGGIKEVVEWHMHPENIQQSLNIIERLAQRYHAYPNLAGIELLNEPRWDIPLSTLRKYYEEGYQRVRKYCQKEDVAVVIHDGFRAGEWHDFMQEPGFSNVILDQHLYQCFTPGDIALDMPGHLQKSALEWKEHLDKTGRELWTYVGEWSLGLDPKTVSLWAELPSDHGYHNLNSLTADLARRAYGAAQLLTFERMQGWFFWSYKTETTPEWCFRDCVERGWLPSDYSREK